MTLSIVAFDRDTASCGVAVASKCLAVGHAVPWGAADAGAIATQALANLTYGPEGTARLRDGESAAAVVQALTDVDPLAGQRQVGIVDTNGQAASFTGPDCLPWAGSLVDGEVAVQGNILVGPEVLDAMLEAYRASTDRPFVQRLLRAVEAGDAAGGDRRVRQSAAIRVWRAGAAYGGGLDIAVDLRVDDHASPVVELARLVDLHDLYFCRPDPATLIDLDEALRTEVTTALGQLGYRPERGFAEAYAEWVGTENFEERDVAGKIDPRVLAHLRQQVGAV